MLIRTVCTFRGGEQCALRAKPYSLELNREKGKTEREVPTFKYLRYSLKKKKTKSKVVDTGQKSRPKDRWILKTRKKAEKKQDT